MKPIKLRPIWDWWTNLSEYRMNGSTPFRRLLVLFLFIPFIVSRYFIGLAGLFIVLMISMVLAPWNYVVCGSVWGDPT